MAKATQITKTVPVTTFVDTPDGVNLRLSMEEVRFLYSYLIHTGGSPTKSPRKLSDNIINALKSTFNIDKECQTWDNETLYDPAIAELKEGYGTPNSEDPRRFKGVSIYFSDYPKPSKSTN